jgi:hypothetical protein
VPSVMIFNNGFSNHSEYVTGRQNSIAMGGVAMWYQLSACQMTISALMYAICTVIIRDYITYFKSLFGR